MDTCTYLGIYPDNIEKASDVLESVCEDFGIDSDDLWRKIDADFEEWYGSNFGNTVNELIFDHLKGAVKDKAALALCLLAFLLSVFFKISPIVFVLFCAAAGILFTRLGVRGK